MKVIFQLNSAGKNLCVVNNRGLRRFFFLRVLFLPSSFLLTPPPPSRFLSSSYHVISGLFKMKNPEREKKRVRHLYLSDVTFFSFIWFGISRQGQLSFSVIPLA